VLLLLACAGAPERVTVLAASSLTVPLERLERTYETANPGVDVVVSTAGSHTLARQIEQGLGADLFLAADAASAARVSADGEPWIANEVVLAFQPGATTASLDALAADARLLRAHGSVPLGGLTDVALARLPVEQRTALADRVVSLEPSARAVVHKLAAGEVDAAWVFASDARRLGLRAVPTGVETRYHRVAWTDGGRRFAAHLDTPAAQDVLREAGFRW
jgi:molybdate transport system substrate-binding protein